MKKKAKKGLVVKGIIVAVLVAIVIAIASQIGRFQGDPQSRASCPSDAPIFCGGCIQACRSYAHTCTDWIAVECGGRPGASSSSSSSSGSSNGGGGETVKGGGGSSSSSSGGRRR